jgi:hypothetical protein
VELSEIDQSPALHAFVITDVEQQHSSGIMQFRFAPEAQPYNKHYKTPLTSSEIGEV